jgi:hypothetical protein
VSLALALGAALAGCARNVRIADAPPPVDLEPVTPLAGYGMELRTWPLDATSWRRSQQNAELAQLHTRWLALQAERDLMTESQDAAEPEGAVGPPVDSGDTEPKTFEAFVQAQQVALPARPGSDALDRYVDTRNAIEARAEAIWIANGLHLALVPIEQLADLRASMGVPGPLERTWWGVTTTWSHLAKGPLGGERRLEIDSGLLTLGPGRLALVGRAWPAPGVGKPVLRVEFCPQFLPVRAPSSVLESRLNPAGEVPNAFAEGPVFERMMLRGSIPSGYALVVVPAAQPLAQMRVGPEVPASSLAETLLAVVGPDGRPRPVALVIVPVLPEWFSLDGG